VALLLSTLSTPIGNLNLLADEHVLLAANLSNVKALKESLDPKDSEKDFKSVARIPIITDLVNDYFDGDIAELNSINVRQPGAPFSQAAWKAMRKVKAGKVISYSELAERAGSPTAVRAAGSACAKKCHCACRALSSHRQEWWSAR